ncbi:MAG: hypothetical protein BWY43_00569 [candidate division WS2 bacterium ADurb.Bin280]|uniref:Uncharacterized protein n=1 Tax=candidate division WS2 bacterium ADurb.Bin280 TaxID=1852829 RepID=A0A1V5SCS4_9BACT|nr:MAG: hypothetical protein BWY43_00569 [candidate division WS2 bacterium ADurb.Bin280]
MIKASDIFVKRINIIPLETALKTFFLIFFVLRSIIALDVSASLS